uniref:cupin domain-containing protein n=1 Tax=Streptomyces olivochromogenes TaxID=1963 RepID=UPI0035B0CCCC
MTALVEFPPGDPGDPGTPPHRHSGPAFGYVLEGEMLFGLEGEPERVIKAGEAFWEPGEPARRRHLRAPRPSA